jgi:hypothetical protein
MSVLWTAFDIDWRKCDACVLTLTLAVMVLRRAASTAFLLPMGSRAQRHALLHFSTCHQASQQAINTKAGFKHAFTQAGQGSVAQVLVLENYCAFARATITSIVLPAMPKTVQHISDTSTYDAVPTRDHQRLWCCCVNGCTTFS